MDLVGVEPQAPGQRQGSDAGDLLGRRAGQELPQRVGHLRIGPGQHDPVEPLLQQPPPRGRHLVRWLERVGRRPAAELAGDGRVDAAMIDSMALVQGRLSGATVTVLTKVAEEFPGLGYTYAVAPEKALADPAQRTVRALLARPR